MFALLTEVALDVALKIAERQLHVAGSTLLLLSYWSLLMGSR